MFDRLFMNDLSGCREKEGYGYDNLCSGQSSGGSRVSHMDA